MKLFIIALFCAAQAQAADFPVYKPLSAALSAGEAATAISIAKPALTPSDVEFTPEDYQKMAALYEKGKKPSVKDLLGWKSGIFAWNEEFRPLGLLTIVEDSSLPQFYMQLSLATTAFDTIPDYLEYQIRQNMWQEPLTVAQGSLESVHILDTNKVANTHLRKNGKFIILRVQFRKYDTIMTGYGLLSKDVTPKKAAN
ncbi:MAG TPA: hypothetical protein PLL10_10250 [Elusimicrobiales bacterium]|nr:hypothetical protein [Elusimicrobiales bacterium]